MEGFLLFFTVIFSIIFIVSWVIPRIVCWIAKRKFKITIKIGKIGIPYFSLCDIHLSAEGFSIDIDEISLKSSFFNSEVTKLITLVVRDVRINKDVSRTYTCDNANDGGQFRKFDFRNTKIPQIINNITQFMAVHIYNISTMFLRSESPGCLTHATASELHIDGSILKNAKSLLVTINLSDATAKVLRHAEKQVKETCLAEFGFKLSSEIILFAQGPLSVENFDLNISHVTATINEGFYNLLQERRHSSNIVLPGKIEEDDTIIHRLLPLIPRLCKIHIDDTMLKGVRENGQIEYNSSLKSLDLTYKSRIAEDRKKNSCIPINFVFSLSDLMLQNSREKLLILKSFNVEAKLEDFIINIYVKLNTLMMTYNHDVIHKWLYDNFLKYYQRSSCAKISQQTDITKCSALIVQKPHGNGYSFMEKLMQKIIINTCAEFCQVSAVVKLNDLSSSVGFTHVRLMLDQAPENRGSTYESYLLKLLLYDRKWQMEVLVESFWWSFKEWNQDSNTSKTIHVWGTPMYLGMGLVKFGECERSEMKIAALLDTVQLEWSLELADYVLLAIKCLKQYGLPSSKKTNQTRVPSKSICSSNILINTAVTHFNCFFQSHNTEYFVSRLNTIAIDKNSDGINVQFEEFKIFSLNNTGAYYCCIRTEDISNYKVFIKSAYLEVVIYQNSEKEISVSLLNEITIFWSTNFHLKSLHLVRDIGEFISDISDELELSTPVQESVSNTSYTWRIVGMFKFHIEISQIHSAVVSFDELCISRNEGDYGLENKRSMISIDNADIFTIKGVKLTRILDHYLIREERLDNEMFVLPWNKTWGLHIDLFKAVFPHGHNYAEAVQNEFISVFKWLKIIHNWKSKPSKSEDSPLPSDILISIKEFLFEMGDDPFEVKLRDNFELLEDEYNESLKRLKMLKEKVSALCKTRLHLPAGKVEELYANLKKKDAEIYIQRSKQIIKASPQRTRLFAWSMTNVELMILADPSIHGMNNVISIMREIDAESPWPEDGLEFSTLWCRVVSLRCKEWKFQLRDFPQPLLDIRQCYICGQLVGAEQVAPRRATRSVVVDLGEPFEPFTVERGMLPLKFYHDFNCEIEAYSYAFGPCWEPVIAQCNLENDLPSNMNSNIMDSSMATRFSADDTTFIVKCHPEYNILSIVDTTLSEAFEKIIPPSRDPSPPLSFWDKMRLLLHGRLTMVVQQLTVLLHASLDPYNTTEEMELTWSQVIMDWTNAKFVYKGDLNIFVRTASKYDDCQLLHLPNLKLIVGLEWVCLGNPNDHHSVIQCAPDKIPEYSSNQVHDSFRAFRSQNVHLSLVIETKPVSNQSPTNFDCPVLLLYGSTLRWIENLKLILSGVTRPTKRGRIFNNVRPRKIQLSRHYKKVHLLVGLHRFQVCYWMSYAMQRGCELVGGRLSSSSEHTLNLVPIDDGLKHRPKTEWSIVYMTSDLNDSEIWLKSALQKDDKKLDDTSVTCGLPVEKCYCLSVAKVSYGRETILPNREQHSSERNKDVPIHRLVVYDLRGAWTENNRNVVFALFDTFVKNQQIKKNLSTEALKGFRKETNTTPLKRRNTDASDTPPNASLLGLQAPSVQETPSPITKLQSGVAANMLKQLIAEADNKTIVYSDDLSSTPRQQHLQGVQACQEDDVQHKNWQIALVNAQVLLKGCESEGYVILSAAKAEIIQRVHKPVWKDRTLVSKTTWTGILECMQYYATVNVGENEKKEKEIMWLTVDNIQEKESTEISEPSEVPNMVGSGVSVGAVVSDTVGDTSSSQLQRIVSRCKCEFFYVGYGDISVDLKAVGEVPPPPQEDVGPWDRSQTAVDAFTLMHYDLDVCTNSLQYAMLLDIVNNLLLYVEPHRKEALEKLARMRFQLQLHSVEDQRRPIQNQQTAVRNLVSKLRRLEKETYLVGKALAENPEDPELLQENERLERLVTECKNLLNAESEELNMMLSCYKESQLLAHSRLATTRSDKPLTIVRANEICFKHAQWRLTEADGQIGIADLVLSNFLYTKNSKSDDSVEHLLELGYLRMTNLLPNEIYAEVLCPTEIQYDMPIEHKKVLRIFCREKPPVGGISVKEHFEINCVPLTIGLTKKFYNTMMKFCFPERDTEANEFSERTNEDCETDKGKKTKVGKRSRDSQFYVNTDDVVEKMKQRAEKNKLFVYIKIPEVPVKVSYKGNKEKNLEDLRDVSIIIPTLEYHNMTWTWLDLLMAIRNDTKKVILSQAIKQKLQIKRNTGSMDESSSPHEEDKARMLFGARHAPENRSIRKGVGGVFKFGK